MFVVQSPVDCRTGPGSVLYLELEGSVVEQSRDHPHIGQ